MLVMCCAVYDVEYLNIMTAIYMNRNFLQNVLLNYFKSRRSRYNLRNYLIISRVHLIFISCK